MDDPHVRRRLVRRTLVAGLVAAAAFAARAGADGCSDCGPPSDAEFRAAMGSTFRDYGNPPDTYEYDGGECTAAVGPVTVHKVREELVAMGTGEAWNCPENACDSNVSFALTLSSENEWHLKASVSSEFDAAILAALKLGVEGGIGGGDAAAGTTTITAHIHSAYCHRTPWAAYFVMGEFEARADYDLKRRFRWWIKNLAAGDRVIASGDVYVVCEGGEAVMGRVWPILGSVTTDDRKCARGCEGVNPGPQTWHPPLPPGIPPICPWPPEPPAPDAPDDGGGQGGDDGSGTPTSTDGSDAPDDPSKPAPPPPTTPPTPPTPPSPPTSPTPPAPPATPVGPTAPRGALPEGGVPDAPGAAAGAGEPGPVAPGGPILPGGDEPPYPGLPEDDPLWGFDDDSGFCPVGPDGRQP